MTRRFVPPPPEAVAEVRRLADRLLSPEDLVAWLETTDEERAEIESLIAWFTRRYPTPADRLRYAARTYEHWARGMPPSK